jgi:hypothetical protein
LAADPSVETLAAAKVSSSATVKTALAAAKVTKTTKAAAAIEFEKVASVFGLSVAQGSSLFPLQRDEANIEIETASAATAATLVGTAKQGASASVIESRPLLGIDAEPSQVAVADRDGWSIQSTITGVASSASALATTAQFDAAELVSGAAAGFENAPRLPQLFSEVSIGRTFRDAMNVFAQTYATPNVTAPQPRHPTSSATLIGVAAVAAEAIWIGYWYARRRQSEHGERLFSDEPMG